MQLLKRYSGLLILGMFILTGCAHIKEAGKGILGISTNEIEKERPKAIKKIFACDYKGAYDKTLVALANMGSYVYTKRDDLIAIYVSQEDTTAVGIFFKEVDPANTELEVSSPSSYAKELVANKLFGRIEVLLSLKDDLKKEEIDKLLTASDKTLSLEDKKPETVPEVVKEEPKPEEPKAEEGAVLEPIKQ